MQKFGSESCSSSQLNRWEVWNPKRRADWRRNLSWSSVVVVESESDAARAAMDGLRGPTPGEMYKDREARKAVMQTSNWIAAQMGPKPDYLPIASTPLDSTYQKSKSETRAAYLDAIETQTRMAREARSYNSPAADFIAKKYAHVGVAPDQEGTTIALGYDPRSLEVSSTKIGASLNLPVEPLDLLERVPTLRDATLDGSHRASQCENHFLPIWSPYDSIHPSRSASYRSANQLREAHHKHTRSQYHPEEKYVLPPTVMSDIGWGLDLKAYKAACGKLQHPDMWHGREASAITQFAQRLQLGARHHLSGPMTKPALHY